uniref:Uncharacterized protein n=1 Tax=Avena sativa TaxID=4498 RepID=A0ACD5WGU4_AVESA
MGLRRLTHHRSEVRTTPLHSPGLPLSGCDLATVAFSRPVPASAEPPRRSSAGCPSVNPPPGQASPLSLPLPQAPASHHSLGSMAWGGLFLSFGRPTPEQQKSCLAAAGGFNYDAALHGASTPKSATALTSEDTDRALADRGFSVNRSRVLVGSGPDAFLRAKSALLSWKHLALGWAEVEPDTPVKVGTRFCICYKEVIPWVMFPLQIAYVTDDNGRRAKGGGGVFAFGSGTLQGHLLAGEERFSVQVDEEERVWYEVFSFSKPAHPLSALCNPYVQFRQRHFARESAKAMLRHVAGHSTSGSQQ